MDVISVNKVIKKNITSNRINLQGVKIVTSEARKEPIIGCSKFQSKEGNQKK
jgi:hypothetical protein